MTKKIAYYQLSMSMKDVSKKTENSMRRRGFDLIGVGAGLIEFGTKSIRKFKNEARILVSHKIPFSADIIYDENIMYDRKSTSLKHLKDMRDIEALRKKRVRYSSPIVDYWRKTQMEEKEDEREAKRKKRLRV